MNVTWTPTKGYTIRVESKDEYIEVSGETLVGTVDDVMSIADWESTT